MFEFYAVEHLQRISSDHAPLSLKTWLWFHSKKKFFILKVFGQTMGCHDSMVKAWNFNPNSSPLHTFSHLISRTKQHLNTWRASALSSLDVDIHNIERDISFLENLYSTANPNSLDVKCLRVLNN